jgi:RHS repeat-associated protein
MFRYRIGISRIQLTSGGSGTILDRSYTYDDGGFNNGNVGAITDNLWNSKHSNDNARSQYFLYDTLNRINLATEGPTQNIGRWGQSYGVDPWGNLTNIGVTKGSATQLNMPATGKNQMSGMPYDAAGNLLKTGFDVSYDAENRINYANGSAYYYDANGQRISKVVGSDITNYFYFGGQPIAERQNNGDWSDYVYAGSTRIAKSTNFEYGLMITGHNNCSGSCWPNTWFQVSNIPTLAGYTIQTGDKLVFRQAQWNARGGMGIFFQDNTNNVWSSQDQNGNYINDDTVQQSWNQRFIDLSSFAGKVIAWIGVDNDGNAPAGDWSIVYGDIAIVSADGTIHSIYNGESSVSAVFVGGSGSSNQVSTIRYLQSQTVAIYPEVNTQYYHGDHLGSSRMMTTADGWPIWQATYLPYGEEYDKQITTNHYQFTGKERDIETGLDYFGARYYGSSMGRFLSPDPIAGTLANPQSLNKYAYVLNSPLIATDPTGMTVNWINDADRKDKEKLRQAQQRQRDYEKRMGQLRKSKDSRDRAVAATYDRLQASSTVFRVTTDSTQSSASGMISPDKTGEADYVIGLKGPSNAYGNMPDMQREGHEFEHGRQVLDGELSFDSSGNPINYDRTDEARAWSAGFRVEGISPDQNNFVKGVAGQVGFGERATVDYLGRTGPYRNLPAGPRPSEATRRPENAIPK